MAVGVTAEKKGEEHQVWLQLLAFVMATENYMKTDKDCRGSGGQKVRGLGDLQTPDV